MSCSSRTSCAGTTVQRCARPEARAQALRNNLTRRSRPPLMRESAHACAQINKATGEATIKGKCLGMMRVDVMTAVFENQESGPDQKH
eukprot:3010257-Prymnesium_polylepis.1